MYFQLDAPHELFSLVTGLEVKDGSEADIVTQIRRYQKNQAARSGLRTQEEGAEDSPVDSQEHALSLLTEYKAREALLELGEGKKSSKKTSGEVDQYEKSVPSHGDEYFHNFISVIRKNPGQLLRYDRLSGSGPLLLR